MPQLIWIILYSINTILVHLLVQMLIAVFWERFYFYFFLFYFIMVLAILFNWREIILLGSVIILSLLIRDSNVFLSFKIECWFLYLCILQFEKGKCVFLSCRNTLQKMHEQHEVQRTSVYSHNNCPLLTKSSAGQGSNAPIFSSQ